MALFTEDGVWDGGETFGRHEGREAVGRYFAEIQRDSLSFCLHGVLTPFLELRSSTTAFGRWYLYMPSTLRDAAGTDVAVWGAAWYEDDLAWIHRFAWALLLVRAVRPLPGRVSARPPRRQGLHPAGALHARTAWTGHRPARHGPSPS